MPLLLHVPTSTDELLDYPPTDPWHRAAIVWAWCRPAQGQNKRDRLSFEEFAALGIPGLSSKNTVSKYWRWFNNAVRVRAVPQSAPGKTIEVYAEDMPWPVPDWYAGRKVHTLKAIEQLHPTSLNSFLDKRYHQFGGGLPRHHLEKPGRDLLPKNWDKGLTDAEREAARHAD